MRRFKIYSINEVLPFVSFITRQKINGHYKSIEGDYDGHIVKMDSQRYQVFVTKGRRCIKCGIEGTFFALEQNFKSTNADRWHFNLYAIDNIGNEILMTKDHIIPKSCGGGDKLDNYQTMCCVCNTKKSIGRN